MLPKSRVVCALLVGLGIALMVGGWAAPRFLNGDARFPLDLENTTWTLHDPNGMVERERTPVTHQLHMTVQNPSDDKVAGLRVGETLIKGQSGGADDLENLVYARTWGLEMDRHSGEFPQPAKLSSTMAFPETSVPIDGVWLKFPVDVQKTTYNVFDTRLRTTAPAEFTGEGEVAGRTVYTFVQDIEPTNIRELYASPQNSTVVEGEAAPPTDGEDNPESGESGESLENAYLTRTAHREFTVDQVTGLVLGMTEKVDDYYADRDGNRVQDFVSFNATMSPEQTEDLAKQLSSVTEEISRSITIAVIAIGALIAAAGVLGALWPRRKQRSRSH